MGLRDSHISLAEEPSSGNSFKLGETGVDGFWAWWFLARIAGPAAEAGHDPSGPGEAAGRVGVGLLGGFAGQLPLDGGQHAHLTFAKSIADGLAGGGIAAPW